MDLGTDVQSRFWAKVCKGGACWLWTGAKSSAGYGRFKISGKLESPHVISFLICKGNIPKGVWVLHTCDNPWCVNPGHLYLGTRSDNTIDALKRGRAVLPTGSRFKKGMDHRFRKLNTDQVKEIRRLLEEKHLGQRSIGKMFGVGQKTISKIYRNERWVE